MAQMGGLMLIFLVSFNVAAVYAKQHAVGGASNWDEGVDYKSWASKQRFVVGDVLVFKYGLTHDVLEVDKDAYDKCDGSNPILFFDAGTALMPLLSTGSKYYICSKSNHCSAGGMKFTVNVELGNPEDYAPPGTFPVPGGAADFLGENYLLIAFSVVLTTFFAFKKQSAS